MAMRRVANHVSRRLLRTGGGTGSVRNFFGPTNTEMYEAKAEFYLKAEAEIIKSGDPQIIEEFRKFKNTYEYHKKLLADSHANIHAADKSTGITVAIAIAVVAYYFSLKRSKPQYEERELVRVSQSRANS